jgi:hypothetical protein|tara:strand:+ start:3668 stop:3958 length:291 start_codon:yes stop_codon:yes gene_type:complete
MSDDWEDDLLEWAGDKQVKKLKANNLIKFVISIVTAIGGFGGGWYKMEDRVSRLEQQMVEEQKIKLIKMEISTLRRDQELEELRFKWKLDSLKRSN